LGSAAYILSQIEGTHNKNLIAYVHADTYRFGTAYDNARRRCKAGERPSIGDNESTGADVVGRESSMSAADLTQPWAIIPRAADGELLSSGEVLDRIEGELALLSMTTDEVREPGTDRVVEIRSTEETWQRLDEASFNLVALWKGMDRGDHVSRCCACVLINGSCTRSIFLKNIELKSGKDARVIGGHG
jgi:hypothetical protein